MPINSLKRDQGLGGLAWRYVWGPVNLVAAFGPLMSFNLIQFPSLALLPFSRHAFRRYNRALAQVVWGWWAWGVQNIVGLKVIVTGDDVPQSENAVVFANHQGMADILVILCLALRKKTLGHATWMAKDPLKYIPGLGWGLMFIETIFLKRNWADDVANIRATFARVMRDHVPIWLIFFPEGTRLKEDKLAASMEYAKESGKEPTRHVLLPRTKGFTASMTGLNGHVDAVYSLTIAYPGRVPKLTELIRGDVPVVHLHVRRFPVEQLARDAEGQAKWLKEEFYVKDALLEHFDRTGVFPSGRSL